jgi:hypothetical protein
VASERKLFLINFLSLEAMSVEPCSVVGVKSSVVEVGRTIRRHKEESVVASLAGASSHETTKKPRLEEDVETKARSKRLFGSLILGTLQKFQQETTQSSDLLTKRQAIDQKLEEKLKQEKEQLHEQLKQQKEERQLQREVIRKEQEQLEGQRLQSLWIRQKRQLAGFLKTQTLPSLYYLPVILDDVTRQQLENDRHRYIVMEEEQCKALPSFILDSTHKEEEEEEEEEEEIDLQVRETSMVTSPVMDE